MLHKVAAFDAEYAEVLRGPQGKLFGRNTIGDLLHVIRSRPTGQLGGKVVATIAEDDQEGFKARIKVPEFAGFSLKLSTVNGQGGGYIGFKPHRCATYLERCGVLLTCNATPGTGGHNQHASSIDLQYTLGNRAITVP